jgi:hypothetical protein
VVEIVKNARNLDIEIEFEDKWKWFLLKLTIFQN